MTVNHLGKGLTIYNYSSLLFFLTETIGKMVFPIMAFLLVQGFYHTKNLKNYLIKLSLVWLISIYPFQMFVHDKFEFHQHLLFNNVIFTLLCGLLMLILDNKSKNIYTKVVIFLVFSCITFFSDWGVIGIFMIYSFYLIHHSSKRINYLFFFTAIYIFVMFLIEYFKNFPCIPIYQLFTPLGVFLAVPLLKTYKSGKAKPKKIYNLFYYLYYPLHLMIISLF